jgi:hypothetical protein
VIRHKLDEIKADAAQELHTKLAYDVQQLVWKNVEARRPRRTLYQRWWYGVG